MSETELNYVERFGNVLKCKHAFKEFSQQIISILSDVWTGDKNLLTMKLSEILLVAQNNMNVTLVPLDLLSQAVEAYKIVSVQDLEENKDEIIAVSNWCAQMAGMNIEIKPSTIEGGGFGLFATADILALSVITDYGGNVVAHGGDYVIEVEPGVLIDCSSGFRISEMARWANGFPPQAEWKTEKRNNTVFTHNKFNNNCICLASTTDIPKGSELFAEYGLFYQWQTLGYEKK